MAKRSKPRRAEAPRQLLREPGAFAQWAFATLVLAIFVALALWNAWATCTTVDEPVHLAAGYSYLKWHDFRLNPEHPPLVKLVAAAPLLATHLFRGGFDPGNLDSYDGADSRSLNILRKDWAAVLAGNDSWNFTHEFYYGVHDAVLERTGASRSSELPTRQRYRRADYLRNPEGMIRAGRTAALGFGVLLGLLVFLWTRELYGFFGGALALTLFAFDPSFIGNSALVTTDVAASLGFFGSVYLLWRATRRLAAREVALLCVMVALAATSKYSCVLLAPIFILLGIVTIFAHREWENAIAPSRPVESRPRRAMAFGAICLTTAAASVLAVWAVYGFRFSAAPDPGRAAEQETRLAPGLNSIPFRTEGFFPFEWTLRRGAADEELLKTYPDGAPLETRDELARSVQLGASDRLLLTIGRHHLLPEAFLNGLATLRATLLRGSFLNGAYSNTGFRTFFLWSFALKTPVVTLALLAIALFALARRRVTLGGAGWFLFVPVIVYFAISIRATLNIGHRHLLPVYPFLFVAIGSVAGIVTRLDATKARRIAATLIAAIVTSSLVVFSPLARPSIVAPHHLSYFNEFAGGPLGGARHLVDSSLDWGQDLPALRSWMTSRGIDGPINLSYFGCADPRFYGIPFVNLEGGYDAPKEPLVPAAIDGYVAISLTNASGVLYSPELRERWKRVLANARLAGRAGYSILIYETGNPWTGR